MQGVYLYQRGDISHVSHICTLYIFYFLFFIMVCYILGWWLVHRWQHYTHTKYQIFSLVISRYTWGVLYIYIWEYTIESPAKILQIVLYRCMIVFIVQMCDSWMSSIYSADVWQLDVVFIVQMCDSWMSSIYSADVWQLDYSICSADVWQLDV